MRKFEHWQDPQQYVSHGWVTAEDIKTRDRRTALVVRAPVGNKIIFDMAGVKAMHSWLGELLKQESQADTGKQISSMSKKKSSKPSNVTRVSTVLGRLYEASKNFEEAEAEQWAIDLEQFLSELASDDAFGTEGQSDPRGDFRNGQWSMARVEGLDK